MDEYGPDTALLLAILARAAGFDDVTWAAMADAFEQVRRRQEFGWVKMARAHAWNRYEAGVAEAELTDAADRLRRRIQKQPWFGRHDGSWVVMDALYAAMLTSKVETLREFSRSDFDTLLAPWRAVIEHCVRSRTALAMMPSWPFPADELWPAVDTALADFDPVSRSRSDSRAAQVTSPGRGRGARRRR
jgi:hypothetical protein